VPRLISRSAWTSTAAGGGPIETPVPFSVDHHSAGPMPKGGENATRGDEEALIRATREFHVKVRGWSDIAYCFGHMPSGRTYVLRGVRTGGHTLGHNTDALGFVFFGNYEIVKPPGRMLDGNRWLLARLIRKGQLSSARKHPVWGHRDVGQTACPGKWLYAMMDYLRTPWRWREDRHHHGHWHPHRSPFKPKPPMEPHHHHRHGAGHDSPDFPEGHPPGKGWRGHEDHHHEHRHRLGGKRH
jgi:hypothetical protein